jgi:copper chaperone CopZ
METLSLELPAMYGDHHVIEVRRILSELAGVKEIYASSSFHTVEVTYDPAQVDADAMRAALDEAGYLDPLEVPLEASESGYLKENGHTFFRHTAAYAQTGKVVGFTQRVSYAGRPLWPCPGMGPITADEMVE